MENNEKRQIIIEMTAKEDGSSDTLSFKKFNISNVEALGLLRLYEQTMSLEILRSPTTSKDKNDNE